MSPPDNSECSWKKLCFIYLWIYLFFRCDSFIINLLHNFIFLWHLSLYAIFLVFMTIYFFWLNREPNQTILFQKIFHQIILQVSFYFFIKYFLWYNAAVNNELTGLIIIIDATRLQFRLLKSSHGKWQEGQIVS